MAAKKRSLKWTWRDYALQLSVVIVGIMITFIGSDLISRWSKGRELKSVMQLVAVELNSNHAELEKVISKLRFDRSGMLLVRDNDMNVSVISEDSLSYYVSVLGSWQGFRPEVDALEVLKTSGAIPSVGNKQLLLDILGCYNRMINLSVNVDTYNKRKIDAIDHLLETGSDVNIVAQNPRDVWEWYMKDPLCSSFFGTMVYYFGYEDTFHIFLDDIDNTVEAITEEYGLK